MKGAAVSTYEPVPVYEAKTRGQNSSARIRDSPVAPNVSREGRKANEGPM